MNKKPILITIYDSNIEGCMCCDMCGETVHSYLDLCPLCKEKGYNIITLGHMAWYEIYPDLLKENNWRDNKFTCRKCKSKFKYVRKEENKESSWNDKFVFEVIENNASVIEKETPLIEE